MRAIYPRSNEQNERDVATGKGNLAAIMPSSRLPRCGKCRWVLRYRRNFFGIESLPSQCVMCGEPVDREGR
jgi:hypothetical protein